MTQASKRIIYSGRVQGVGFRATTKYLANSFTVSGYVKNLPDGTVEVVASGNFGEVDRFLQAIDQEFGSKIHDRSVSEFFPTSDELSGFSIRY